MPAQGLGAHPLRLEIEEGAALVAELAEHGDAEAEEGEHPGDESGRVERHPPAWASGSRDVRTDDDTERASVCLLPWANDQRLDLRERVVDAHFRSRPQTRAAATDNPSLPGDKCVAPAARLESAQRPERQRSVRRGDDPPLDVVVEEPVALVPWKRKLEACDLPA